MSEATTWFDQFPPYEDWPELSIRGVQKPEEFQHEQWCARHWAPCPLMGANGIGATIEVMQIFLDEVKPKNLVAPNAVNRYMQQVGRLCCTLGDERMYEIWGHWPPKGEDVAR